MGALALLIASAVCMAAPVQRHAQSGSPRIVVGPLTGYLTEYDVVGGRFALRAGGMRTATLSQKIPWFVAPGASVGNVLVVSGRTLSLPLRAFRQTFTGAYPVGDPTHLMFPTNISPPAAGCWLLTVATGTVSASIPVRVRPRVRA